MTFHSQDISLLADKRKGGHHNLLILLLYSKIPPQNTSPSVAGVVHTMSSFSNTMSVCSTFTGSKLALSIPVRVCQGPFRLAERVVHFLLHHFFFMVLRRIIAQITSRRVLMLSTWALTLSIWLRMLSHTFRFAFLVTVEEKGAKTIVLFSLTSGAKSNFCDLDSMSKHDLKTSTVYGNYYASLN